MAEVAKAAGVEIATFLDFELQRRPASPETLAAIRAALEAAGGRFCAEERARRWATAAGNAKPTTALFGPSAGKSRRRRP
jgi:hypothetical protein